MYLLNSYHIIPPFLAAHLSIKASESPAHEKHLEAGSLSPLEFRAPAILAGTDLDILSLPEKIKRVTSE